MAITATQSNDHVKNMAVGRRLDTGTVAAFDVVIGFKPRYVKVVNVTSGDVIEWYEGMADASGCKTTGATGVRTLITSNGITVDEGGFTVGLDTDLVVTSEQLSWIALV